MATQNGDDYLAEHPVNLSSYCGDESNGNFNTIYYQDQESIAPLKLELFNELDKQIQLQSHPTSGASANNCHFALRFLKGVLANLQINIQEASDWDISVVDTHRNKTLYFLRKNAITLEARGGSSNNLSLTLNNVAVDHNHSSSTGDISLVYGPLLTDDKGQPFQNNGVYYSVQKQFSFKNNSGIQQIPLRVGIVGPNTILNDGTSSNNLKLRIANILKENGSQLQFTSNSKFTLSFDVDNGTACQEWMLGPQNLVDHVSVSLTSTDVNNNWSCDNRTIQPRVDTVLKAGVGIEIDLSNIVTNYADGTTNIYVYYEKIPGYSDGQFVIPVEKSPLVYRDSKVGIGVVNPDLPLTIANAGTGLSSPGKNQLAFHTNSVQQLRIDNSGICSNLYIGNKGDFYSTPPTASGYSNLRLGTKGLSISFSDNDFALIRKELLYSTGNIQALKDVTVGGNLNLHESSVIKGVNNVELWTNGQAQFKIDNSGNLYIGNRNDFYLFPKNTINSEQGNTGFCVPPNFGIYHPNNQIPQLQFEENLLYVSTGANVGQSLQVQGDAHVGRSLQVQGDAHMGQGLQVQGDVEIQGKLKVKGNVEFESGNIKLSGGYIYINDVIRINADVVKNQYSNTLTLNINVSNKYSRSIQYNASLNSDESLPSFDPPA